LKDFRDNLHGNIGQVAKFREKFCGAMQNADSETETVKTVDLTSMRSVTPLKRG
jgi:hypothetical protein